MKVYSANEISCLVGGVPIDSGRGDDEFISIDKPDDSFTYKAGVDGEGTRSENRNTYHVLTLTLMRTSRGNAVLTALHQADLNIAGGAGIAPVMVRDRQGASLFVAAEAWVIKFPTDVYAKEAGTVQWMLGVHAPLHVLGGN
jgi:hypothetical protein